MSQKKKHRTGGLDRERERIVAEYARGNYLRTSADEAARLEEKSDKSRQEEEHNGDT